MRVFFAVIFLISLLLLNCAPASSASPDSTNAAQKKGAVRKVKKKVEIPTNTSVGVFIGNLIDKDIRQSSIFVKPFDRDGPKQRFYFDTQTVFDNDKKKIALDQVAIGSLVVVKYFAAARVRVAEIVNVLPTDVEITEERVKRWMRGERGSLGSE